MCSLELAPQISAAAPRSTTKRSASALHAELSGAQSGEPAGDCSIWGFPRWTPVRMPRMNDLVPIGKKKGRLRAPGSTAGSRVAVLLQDIHELRAAVRQNTEDIRQLRSDVHQNTEDIRQLREEIRSMRELLERKADHEALLKLQTRVEVVERRLGIQ